MKDKNEELISIELKKKEWKIIIGLLKITKIDYEISKRDKKIINQIKEIIELIEIQLKINKTLNKKKSH